MNLSKRSFFGEISNELKQIPKETSLEIDLNDEFSTDLEFSERTNKFSHFNNFKDKVDDLMKHYETQYNNLLIPDKENILTKHYLQKKDEMQKNSLKICVKKDLNQSIVNQKEQKVENLNKKNEEPISLSKKMSLNQSIIDQKEQEVEDLKRKNEELISLSKTMKEDYENLLSKNKNLLESKEAEKNTLEKALKEIYQCNSFISESNKHLLEDNTMMKKEIANNIELIKDLYSKIHSISKENESYEKMSNKNNYIQKIEELLVINEKLYRINIKNTMNKNKKSTDCLLAKEKFRLENDKEIIKKLELEKNEILETLQKEKNLTIRQIEEISILKQNVLDLLEINKKLTNTLNMKRKI